MQQTSVGAVGTPVTGKGGGGGGDGGSSARLHHHWWGHGHGHAHAQDAAQGSMNRRASMEAEMQRVKQLPSSSNYAAHRIRVLGKAMQLLSIVPEVSIY